MLHKLPIALTILFVACGLAGAASANSTLQTKLSGDEEVPAVLTRTSGNAKIKVNKRQTEADFRVTLRRGEAITQAHLHCAPAGENGPVVAFLSGMVPGGFDTHGKYAQATLTDANIEAVGADCMPSAGMRIENIADLEEALEAGLIYVNVHSVANPGGEVRGQF
jgi:hypothetical protein